ncbi:MAG: hypothetical protein IJQ50_04495 [Clostridia bacterium]|nr:hypothetical protein [Clostridia bacterium]
MQGLIYFAVFALLAGGAFLILNLSLIKRKSKITLSKLAADDRRKKVDEKYSKLTLFERIMVNIKETVTMSGFKMNTFWLFVVLAGFGGIAVGKFLFTNGILSIATGLALLPIPYIILKIRARWYKRSRDEMLENSMNLITNSYLGCNDIITAVNENLDKLDIPKPFAEFVTDVTLIDSNIKRALMKLDLKIKNKYFSEWIDILILAQEKSGDYRFILPAVVQSMNDAKRLQIEADTVMMNVWKDYFTAIILAFSIIPLLRWSNEEWFNILIGTTVGNVLIILLLLATVISAFITLKINKPL